MTLGLVFEKYGGLTLSAILTVGLCKLHPTYEGSLTAIRNLPTITTCIFGFLLTLFGIIIQGNGTLIKKMKNTNVVFSRYLSFTKRIIIISLGLSVFAFVLGSINPSWLTIQFENSPKLGIIIKDISMKVLVFFCFWLIIDLFYFIYLFFLLIQTEK